MLDASAYPHLVDAIFTWAPYDSLLSLRTASRTFKSRADALLSHSISIITRAGVKPILRIRTQSNYKIPTLHLWEECASLTSLTSLSPSLVDIHLSHPISQLLQTTFALFGITPNIVRYRGSVVNYRPIEAPLSIGTATLTNPNIDSDSEEDGECDTLLTYTCDVGAPASSEEHIIAVKFDPGHVHLPEAWIGGLRQVNVPKVTVVFVPSEAGGKCGCTRNEGGYGVLEALGSLRAVPFGPGGSVERLTLVNVRALGWKESEGQVEIDGVEGEGEDAELGDIVRRMFRTEINRRRLARVPPFAGWSEVDTDVAVGTIRLLSLEEWRVSVGEEVAEFTTDWKACRIDKSSPYEDGDGNI